MSHHPAFSRIYRSKHQTLAQGHPEASEKHPPSKRKAPKGAHAHPREAPKTPRNPWKSPDAKSPKPKSNFDFTPKKGTQIGKPPAVLACGGRFR